MAKEKMTKHHLLPRSKEWIDNYDNILMLQESTHRALHKLFHNATPVEQMKKLVNLNAKILSAEFRYEINRLLEFWEDEWAYKDWIKNK